jgi:hypothetical protein
MLTPLSKVQWCRVGKKFVIKQYIYKTVITMYPDMNGIVPSQKQKIIRRLMK